MIDKHFILEDADHYITLNQEGQIVVELVFIKYFDGDMKLLLSYIEENIIPNDEGNGEHINWSMVVDDYENAGGR